jgi:hypothetical protein
MRESALWPQITAGMAPNGPRITDATARMRDAFAKPVALGEGL